MSQFQKWDRPLTLQIDLNQATYQAFLNCINSFQGLETESVTDSRQGATHSTMSSKVSMERFVYNLGVLDGILGEKDSGSWKGGEYQPDSQSFSPFKYWGLLVRYLKDVGFFKSPRRISHL